MEQQEIFKKFRLKFLQDHLEDFLQQAKKSPLQAMDWWLQNELQLAKINSEKRRFKESKIGVCMAKEDFDWSFIQKPRELRQQIENLIRKDFVQQARNIIFIGPEGVGKTTLSKILGYEMIIKGYNCKFVNLAHLIQDLNMADNPYSRPRVFAKYTNPQLLILDEVGYVSYDPASADNLFQVISKRHEENKPLILNTNLAFQDWGKFLGTAHCVSAIVDRLIENASIINIDAESFRNHKHKKDDFDARKD